MICMQGVNCQHKEPVFSDSDIQSQSFSTVLPVSHLSRITSVMDCKESFEHKNIWQQETADIGGTDSCDWVPFTKCKHSLCWYKQADCSP